MRLRTLPLVFAVLAACSIGRVTPEPSKPGSRTDRTIAGWRIRVDNRLLTRANAAVGRRALQLLESQLADIASVVAPDRVEELRAVPIVLDLTHGDLIKAQYHPSPEWLADNGYALDLAKCVHIPNAAYFIDARYNNDQPWRVLHELAHAYHDQVLSDNEPGILAAWKKFDASGHGDSVLRISGRREEHYALTDQMEFFAEMTEAYFGRNDYFPFNRAELQEAEPEVFELLKDVWGAVPWEQ